MIFTVMINVYFDYNNILYYCQKKPSNNNLSLKNKTGMAKTQIFFEAINKRRKDGNFADKT